MTKDKFKNQQKVREIGTKLIHKINHLKPHDKSTVMTVLGIIDMTYRDSTGAEAKKFEADVQDILGFNLKDYVDKHGDTPEDYLWLKF